MLKRFAEAGVAVFQNRSTVDKFVHCQGISGNIKMMCWSKKTCSCHWRKTNGCKIFANKRWNRGETNPFLTHPDHVQTLWNKKIKKIWQLSNWRKQTAAKLEKNLERNTLVLFVWPVRMGSMALLAPHVLLESIQPSTYSFWAFKPVYTKAFRPVSGSMWQSVER